MTEKIIVNPDDLKYDSEIAKKTGDELSNQLREFQEAADNVSKEEWQRLVGNLSAVTREHMPNVSKEQISEIADMFNEHLNEIASQKEEYPKQR